LPVAGSVDGRQFAVVEIEPTTQEYELAKHGAERRAIVRGDSGMLLHV
jgi:hypothetical protein